ncbi:TetR/AcrR family transcriptional regulator C-terminal domain-containing protein [Micromonospora robiginosa]|uniref:TetR/AcrR family transcriptional regulator C-terminal domain-containing protein n=1 Tax=Micromonospora robiginosa TaxID=2749844 RepID=A0A7L6B014_9ACTN|nr:TetR/AcrR family transcriptional regulator C-terminal domain-containing protein [Micromonospora ferruginea]QLQ35196.1 TetR/AcrR family transcriptional regulator C-terminal domain-containing protein [Micromonospora ferruginea]
MSQHEARQQPPYQRIATEIRHRIERGELLPGDRVPSARQLTREHGIAIATATRVLARLRDDGLVLTRPGAGTVVAETAATARPARARPEPSRDRVLRTAVALADAGGLAAVTLRAVAAELGVATLALHRHLRGRDELILAMADAALADSPLPAVEPTGWRARLEVLARAQWAVYRRHRWLPHVITIARPQPLPHGMAHTDRALRATAGLGLDRNTRWHVAITLMTYVKGVAVNLEAGAQAVQDTGLTDEEWVDRQQDTFQRLMAGGGLATMDALTAGGVDLDLETVFDFGLQRLLDGVATLIERPVSPGR